MGERKKLGQAIRRGLRNPKRKKVRTNEGESAPAPEKPSLSLFQHGNSTELGTAGQFLTSLFLVFIHRLAADKIGNSPIK